ncbi:MAG: nucleotide exchange factor GrpE [Bacteroidota bacterium]
MSKKQVTKEKETKKNKEAQVTSEDQQKEQNEEVQSENLNEDIKGPANDKEVEEEVTINNDAAEEEEDEKELLKRQLEEQKDKYIRLVAEYDNFRKRTLREKMELSKSAGESVLLSLLPVIDDFDRALSHLDDSQNIEAVKEGINLIYSKFQDFLKQQGISEIETIEEEFNGDLHEAVTKIPAPSEDMKGKIIDCVQKGYKLNDKVIRHPKVVVGE